jgi:2-phosphosulfolactate phosphatase
MVSLASKPSQGTNVQPRPLRIEVAFTPTLLAEPEGKVCLVVDMLRLTSSVVTMFARGLSEALVAGTIEEARRLAGARRGYLLCGEEHGKPPEGFDHGNSPSEFDALDLAGRRAVLATTNGTPALEQAAASPVVLMASMLNASAAVAAALREATAGGRDIAIVCAGSGRGRFFSLEDAFCAGALVDALASREGAAVSLWSSAAAARRLYRSYRGSASAMYDEADHAKSIAAIGFGADLAFCAQRDAFDIVPRLECTPERPLRIVAG